MRPIHTAELDKRCSVLVLTRELVRPAMTGVTVAPTATRERGLAAEVTVGPDNGLDELGVVSCDDTVTIPASVRGRVMGYLLEPGAVPH